MREGGVIASDAVRQPLHPIIRAGLIEIARQLDPVVLRWGYPVARAETARAGHPDAACVAAAGGTLGRPLAEGA